MIGGVCAVLVLSGATGSAESAGPIVAAGPNAAATCDPENPSAASDIDGDGRADVAVGMPLNWNPASVDIRLTGSPSIVMQASDLGAGNGEMDSFGEAITVGDLDQDGCADLVIGAPYEGQSAASDGAGGVEGQVHLVFGKAGGVDTRVSLMLPHDSSRDDHFGAALALQVRYDPATGKNVHDLYVGAPHATVNGHRLAGEVFRYTIAPSATGRVAATLREVRTQDSAGVPGHAEGSDGFGMVLAATEGGVLVGDPQEAVGKVLDAGALWFLRVNAAGAAISSRVWTQNSPGVPGIAETEDGFGKALGVRGLQAVIGVPGEGLGSRNHTGMIQVFTRTSATGDFKPGKAINQGTRGIPGRMERSDLFGSAIAVGTALLCPESTDVAVGVPGEAIGTRRRAGSVVLIQVSGERSCPAKVLRQGSGLSGTAEAHDKVGSVLGLTQGRNDLAEDGADRLLIGVPLEDIKGLRAAGIVQSARGGLLVNGVVQPYLTFSKGYQLASAYGAALSQPAAPRTAR